jgi:hypothetical protein
MCEEEWILSIAVVNNVATLIEDVSCGGDLIKQATG